MDNKWIVSPIITKILWSSSVVVFVAAETMLFVTSFGKSTLNHHVSVGYSLVIILINAIPFLVGFKGYRVLRAIRLKGDEVDQDRRLIWLSRQFVASIAVAYAVVIADLVFLTDAFRMR